MTVPQEFDVLQLAPPHVALLQRYGFDLATFLRLRGDLAQGRFDAERNRLDEPVAPPGASDIAPWPHADGAAGRALATRGRALIDAGLAAVAILNGGMATRFGGRVKGVVEVVDGLSFLALKLRAVAALGRQVPVFLMNSFATDADTRAHLEAHDYFGVDRSQVHVVTQRISLRLTPQGDIFRDAQGAPSFYAPGHGDLLAALAGHPAFQALARRPEAVVAVSNVDNLGATLEPRVIGAHLASSRAMTTEVAPRAAGNSGGTPVRRRGRVEILEGFRLPAQFDPTTLPVFNTNTFVFDATAVRPDYDLTWFRADKKVDGAPVVQFERLLGEVTAHVDSAYLQVPRDGAEGRFMPVKTPDDIVAVRPLVRARFGL